MQKLWTDRVSYVIVYNCIYVIVIHNTIIIVSELFYVSFNFVQITFMTYHFNDWYYISQIPYSCMYIENLSQ